MTLTASGEPERLRGLVIDANLLRMIGIEPALGRNFTEAEDAFGASPVALIGHAPGSAASVETPSRRPRA